MNSDKPELYQGIFIHRHPTMGIMRTYVTADQLGLDSYKMDLKRGHSGIVEVEEGKETLIEILESTWLDEPKDFDSIDKIGLKMLAKYK